MTSNDILVIRITRKGEGSMERIVPFQIRLVDSINRAIKSDAAINDLTKHEWIEKAIMEKLQRDNKAV